MPAYFKCKNCGQEHLCPLYFTDEPSFQVAGVGPTSLACPVTFKTATYDKGDLCWIKGDQRRGLSRRFAQERTPVAALRHLKVKPRSFAYFFGLLP